MKKPIFLCIVFAAIASLTGCDSSGGSKSLLGTTTAGGVVVSTQSTFTMAQQTYFTQQLFYAAVAGFNHRGTAGSTFNITSYSYAGPLSGMIGLSGSGTYLLSGSLYTWNLASLTESLNSYMFQYNGVNYILTGNINVIGTLTTSGTNFLSPSTFSITGNYTANGGGLAQGITVSVSITPNSTGTGGTMSGTIGGQPINQSF